MILISSTSSLGHRLMLDKETHFSFAVFWLDGLSGVELRLLRVLLLCGGP